MTLLIQLLHFTYENGAKRASDLPTGPISYWQMEVKAHFFFMDQNLKTVVVPLPH